MAPESTVNLMPENRQLLLRLQQCKTLPSLPGVAERILALSDDPAATMGDVSDAVAADPALAAKLLRVSNSAMYGQSRQIGDLRQAVTLLGLQAALALALSFSLIAGMQANPPCGFNYLSFWRRSLAAASVSRQIAVGMRKEIPERYFMAGLLQDIGMLALVKVEPGLYESVGADEAFHAAAREAELKALGVDHAAVGAWLVNSWHLPEFMQSAVALSHEDNLVHMDATATSMGQTISVAAAIADAYYDGPGNDSLYAEASDKAGRLLGLEGNAVSNLFDGLAVAMRELGDMLDVDTGSEAQTVLLQENAREALALRSVVAIGRVAEMQRASDKVERRAQKLIRASRTDGLTGALSRAFLDKELETAFAASNASSEPLSVAFLDVDKFKAINDSHGHLAGDRVLQLITRCLQSCTRDTDIVGRFGGDEFMLVLPACKQNDAMALCERCVRQIESVTEPMPVRVSIGVACHNNDRVFPSAKDLVEAADKASYSAKRDTSGGLKVRSNH